MTTTVAIDRETAFVPLPWQIDPWRDQSPVLFLSGSAGGGKSRLAAEKIHALMLHYPGATGIVGRKDKVAANKSVVPFLTHTVQGGTVWGEYKTSAGVFDYDNGSQLWVVGMNDEKQREALRSIGKNGAVDFAWFEEANKLTEEDHNEITGRMRGTAANWTQIIYTSNPDAPGHWMNQRLIIGGEAAVYYSGAADNPHNPPEYQETLNRLTGVQRLRLRDGLWVQAEGAIYEGFDKSVHVQTRSPDEFAMFWLACDEGYTNPAVILLVGEDYDGRLHVFAEFYRTGALQNQVVQRALDMALPHMQAQTFESAIVDQAAAGLIAALLDAGINARGHKGAVFDGITRVQGRLIVEDDGRPRLTVDPGCVNTINEFESYAWKPGRDEPEKTNDHAMDALRYLVDYRDAQGGWLIN